jgi:hypothetical protein
MELEFPVIRLFRNNDFCERLTLASTDCLSTLQITYICSRVQIYRFMCCVKRKFSIKGVFNLYIIITVPVLMKRL